MKSFFHFLIAYAIGGSLGIMFVETASTTPLQHSGAQPYVRVVR